MILGTKQKRPAVVGALGVGGNRSVKRAARKQSETLTAAPALPTATSECFCRLG
jgi:hypothetical protein